MVEIHVLYEGGLRCQATHGPSRNQLTTDAPVDNHGQGESFSPTDLAATALGTCMLTIMGIAAEKHGWDLTGSTASVKKRMLAAPVRRIGKIEVEIRVPRSFDARTRALLEAAALACPVHQSLHPEVEKPVHFRWGSA